MGRFGSSRFTRVDVEPEVSEIPTSNSGEINPTPSPESNELPQVKKPIENSKKAITLRKKISFKERVLSRVFSEDYDGTKNKILDPKGQTVRKWNKALFAACLVSLFVDPLFFFLPIVSGDLCIDMASNFRIILTVVRSALDVFYWIQILVKFHTAYVAPSSRVLGRGELVIDSSKIAMRYLRGGFVINLIAALPIPQVLVWFVVERYDGWAVMHIKNAVWLLIIVQYVPRAILVFLLYNSQVAEAAGVVGRTAWAGAAYNLLLYMIGAHVSGACYYLFTLERQEDCWHSSCNQEVSYYCPDRYFDCRQVDDDPNRASWFMSTNVSTTCNGWNVTTFEYGIYGPAVQFNVGSVAFMNKYFYNLWWGLKNLSTIGQNLITSIYVGENIFVAIVGILGLLLLALLIGHMQRYLFSTTRRLEEWKIKRADTEQWMHQRQLPLELRDSVRKYDRYKWLATEGVDEEALLKSFPLDLRRKVKRHLCFELVRQVPLFDKLDETMLDAICERLKPAWCVQDLCLLREGDPVSQMLFIIRGSVDSFTITDGTVNFYHIGPGGFCGEELLTWALDRRPSVTLPLSTSTVKATNEVEAFALMAQDLKFVASQFRRLLHSNQVRHKFRYYSHPWRIWAARTLQVGWRRYKKFKEMGRPREPGNPPPGSFWSVFAETLVASARWTGKDKQVTRTDSAPRSSIEKPEEPDFSDDETESWANVTKNFGPSI